LKVEIPTVATPQSQWMVTRQDKFAYYAPKLTKRTNLFSGPGDLHLWVTKGAYKQPDADAHAMAQGMVSITPLSLDNTSRVDLSILKGLIG
jgi:broad specificity polyphosphatase/5'/3'-nucleotidase SurE